MGVADRVAAAAADKFGRPEWSSVRLINLRQLCRFANPYLMRRRGKREDDSARRIIYMPGPLRTIASWHTTELRGRLEIMG